MSETRDRLQRHLGEGVRRGSSLAFTAFILVHTGCGEELAESRLDEDTLVSQCPRCGEIRIFSTT